MSKIYDEMAAMPTTYKDVKFRSRTEARWAVFFDALGIEWQYEPKMFPLQNGDHYLPDFYLPRFNHPDYSKKEGSDWSQTNPEVGLYVEVKPKNAGMDMFAKANRFSREHGKSVLLLNGAPRYSEYRIIYAMDEEAYGYYGDISVAIFRDKYLPGGTNGTEYRLFHDEVGNWEVHELPWLCGSGVKHALDVVHKHVFDTVADVEETPVFLLIELVKAAAKEIGWVDGHVIARRIGGTSQEFLGVANSIIKLMVKDGSLISANASQYKLA